MKHKLFFFISLLLTITSCRNDETNSQKIDQVLDIYIKNSEDQDLLNSKISGSYSSVALLDLLSETKFKNISGYSLQKNKDTITYLNYIAGATRLLQDSINPDKKTYYSEFIIRLTKTQEKQQLVDDDTIRIEYNWSPSLFQVSTLWYNNKIVFTKVEGQPNVITIVK